MQGMYVPSWPSVDGSVHMEGGGGGGGGPGARAVTPQGGRGAAMQSSGGLARKPGPSQGSEAVAADPMVLMVQQVRTHLLVSGV